MLTISICIATHERTNRLRRTLDALRVQERLPDEIIVSDSSASGDTADLVHQFAQSAPELCVQRVPSDRRALPWQRWLACSRAHGDIVLFLDDDVSMAPSAIATLERAYAELVHTSERPVAGIGFIMTWADGTQPRRRIGSFRERWLGITQQRAGRLSAGGIAVSVRGLAAASPVEVDFFWGGAMSFRRDVLQRVGCLDGLISLYEQGIGRGEDGVLSHCAGRFGALYLITQPLALHPIGAVAGPTPYARGGWRMGLTGTWGRAHTLRWLASDWAAYRHDWLRTATLELGRSMLAVAKRPWRHQRWARLFGALAGAMRTVRRWNKIPASPGSRHLRWND